VPTASLPPPGVLPCGAPPGVPPLVDCAAQMLNRQFDRDSLKVGSTAQPQHHNSTAQHRQKYSTRRGGDLGTSVPLCFGPARPRPREGGAPGSESVPPARPPTPQTRLHDPPPTPGRRCCTAPPGRAWRPSSPSPRTSIRCATLSDDLQFACPPRCIHPHPARPCFALRLHLRARACTGYFYGAAPGWIVWFCSPTSAPSTGCFSGALLAG
jgi:hypothetical protein